MANLQATLLSAVSEEPETSAPETPDTEEPEAPEAPDTDDTETPDTEDPDTEEPEEDPTPELDDDATFRVGDETLTGKDLKAQRLMQADYTRKTQALADEREAFETKRAAEADELEDIKHWLGSLQDPEDMEFELATYFPKAFEALRDRILEQAVDEHEMTERERALFKEKRKNDFERKARQKQEEYAARKEAAKKGEIEKAEMAKRFSLWREDSVKAAGLDPKNEQHLMLVSDRIVAAYRGKKWTPEIFQAASEYVAKALGKTPPKAKEPEKKAAAKLPPVRAAGAKKPVGTPEAKAPAKAKSSNDFFKDLRKQVGLP